MLEGLLNKLRGKGKKQPSEKDVLELAQRMEKRLKQVCEKDPEAKKYLEAKGYDPEEKYTNEELRVFTTYLGTYSIEKHKKGYKEKKNASYA